MNATIQLYVFLIFAATLSILGLRLAAARKNMASVALGTLGLLIAVFAVNAWHHHDKKVAAGKLGGALVILEDRMKARDDSAALKIVDHGIRLFGSSQVSFDEAASALWTYAIQTKEVTKQPTAPAPEVTISATSTNVAPTTDADHHLRPVDKRRPYTSE